MNRQRRPRTNAEPIRIPDHAGQFKRRPHHELNSGRFHVVVEQNAANIRVGNEAQRIGFVLKRFNHQVLSGSFVSHRRRRFPRRISIQIV